MISVIIPYNKDRGYLERCIESIQIQQGVEFEIIMSHNDKPVSVNFNLGLAKAKGEFCKYVCEDDYLPQFALMNLVQGIGDKDWAFANAIQESTDDKWIYRPGDYSKDFLTLQENLKTNRIHGGTTIYRTELLKQIGGLDETLWTAEEYDMHLKLWTAGHVPGYINKEVYIHTLWSGQKSKFYRKTKRHERDKEIKRIQSFYLNEIQSRDL